MLNVTTLAGDTYNMEGLPSEKFLILFGKQLKTLRTEKNLSYRELSQRCNVDYSDISKIEKGKIRITLPTVYELSLGLEIHPKKLFDFSL